MREDEKLRERHRYFEKYRERAAAPFGSTGLGRQEEGRREPGGPMPNGNGNGQAHAQGSNGPSSYPALTTAAEPMASHKAGQVELEVKREALSATPAKSPTPSHKNPPAQGGGGMKVNGNGPTTHIEIINIHDPVPSPLPAPGPPAPPSYAPTSKPTTPTPPVPAISPVPAPAPPVASHSAPVPTPTTAIAAAPAAPPGIAAAPPVEMDEDVSMLQPASPPSSSFEGPASVPPSVSAPKEEEGMDVDEESAGADPRLEQMESGAAAPAISAT